MLSLGIDHRSGPPGHGRPPFSSTPRFNGSAGAPRQYRTMYEKTYVAGSASGRNAWGANTSLSNGPVPGKSRMTAKEVMTSIIYLRGFFCIFLADLCQIKN